MLSEIEAKKIVSDNLPEGLVQSFISYEDVYIFKVFFDDPLEGQWDPFFSVNKKTGELRDFSILTDGDISEITELFMKKEAS